MGFALAAISNHVAEALHNVVGVATSGMGSVHDVVGEGVGVRVMVEEAAGVVEVGGRGP